MAESASPRLQMMHKRLESAVSQLLNDGHPSEDLAADRARVEKYIDAYEEGKLFFGRDTLASLDRQIDALRTAGAVGDYNGDGGVVTLKDVIGNEKSWSLTPPECNTFCIRYTPHQIMTHMSTKYPEYLLEAETPLAIGYQHPVEPSGRPLCDLEAAFRAHQASWLASATCKSLTTTIAASVATLRAPINNIVCFGLGRLDEWKLTNTPEELAKSVQRAAWQHAAALTMAETLTRAQGGGGDEVRCYTQDPVYADVEKQLLAALGFEILEDPKGFLAVDDRTLVFSVTPNVPVRQIVADMVWPAAMVWDVIDKDRDDEWEREWRTDMNEGLERRISPWFTDEGSIRITEMGQHYTFSPFPGDLHKNNFGSLGIYFRK
ncbi:Sensitivity To Red Light Reduced-SRR1 [Cordyceps militaris]|uniref:Sensitivity To Red Light Reduced-SRR1 n=1 Tax=Cordyceps militaris TaxID=73501 RepID=A0A2H4SGT5_CORMI|nr:Sensitivity To Red Light Reduced-SRR1 [Cordyceps militaris]